MDILGKGIKRTILLLPIQCTCERGLPSVWSNIQSLGKYMQDHGPSLCFPKCGLDPCYPVTEAHIICRFLLPPTTYCGEAAEPCDLQGQALRLVCQSPLRPPLSSLTELWCCLGLGSTVFEAGQVSSTASASGQG